MRRIEWPTVLLIVACYGLWVIAVFLVWPDHRFVAIAMMMVMSALHSSLTHECLHGHPTRHRRVNEALVAMPLSLIYPYRRYRQTHLAHHRDARLTDPFEDPESYYKARWQYERMPGWFRRVLQVNNTLLGRIVLGPVLGAAGFLSRELSLLLRGDAAVGFAWLLNLAGAAPLLLALYWAGIPLWLYVLAVVWPSLSLIAVRTFAEHRWHAEPDGRTIIVEHSLLAPLFLNNNLHIVHHKLPAAPWYALPRLYAERTNHWQSLNDGYVYRNYLQLFRAFAIRAKEPVPHPALQRDPPASSQPTLPPQDIGFSGGAA